jgi:hypothetical protein
MVTVEIVHGCQIASSVGEIVAVPTALTLRKSGKGGYRTGGS